MNVLGGRFLECRVKPSPPGQTCPVTQPLSLRPTHQQCSSLPCQRNPLLQKQLGRHAMTTCTHAASPKVMFLGLDSKQAARDGITLPLQHIELLGLNAGQTYKDSTINQRYDDLISTPMEAGYSQQTVDARGELLSSVLSDIICSKGKKMEKDLVLPFRLIPGALAILAEVNHDDLVLYLGQELLDSRELDGYPLLKQDVLLSMALAKYNAARDLFDTPDAQVQGHKGKEASS
ncbi:hypothetical protein DUNSADRAFT_8387 [Dunaliella salina]|uniref:Plastid division protein CDP1-like 1st alpha solenoid domain-containing protein n=1 Tax=Dunaliella salina TaxID=3046 RepID=A0ABQ7GJT4_DUNSA|nr:hypothetical protein DUNSADRAFT_8387 [Dunaliella salina]|eukprot:KAF5834803.1 hypothetical protein DUNSADRAFT_8387 [Dunaliella salina]